MNITEFFNLFLLISAVIGFIFSGILFYSKNGKDRSMLFLNLMILSISLNNLQSWILAEGLFQHKFRLDYIQIPWHFFIAPFFYMFLVSYLDIEKKSLKILPVVISIFIIGCVAQISFVLNYSGTGSIKELDHLFEKYTSIEEIFSIAVSLFLFAHSFYILYKKEDLFPKILAFDNLKWIYTFFQLLSFGYVLWILALIVKFKLNFTGFLFSYYPLRIHSTILIFWLGYQAILQLRILKERKEIRKKITAEKIISKKGEQNNPNLLDEEFSQIDIFIKKEKKYLQVKYTLNDLSEDLKIGTSKLSAIINNNANKSFIDYINEMRIEQAKKLLTDETYKNYTIASVGLESGFNSKSTFYTTFKKHTGSTPLGYKNSYSC